MAIDLGSGNTTRYHSVSDHADFTLPNADWAWVALVRPAASANPRYLISTNTVGTDNSFNLFIDSGYQTVSAQVNTQPILITSTLAIPNGAWAWMFATRITNSLRIGWIPVGGTSINISGPQALTAGSNGSLLYIGARNDLSTARFWQGSWGQVAFVSGAGISPAQAIELAQGVPLLGTSFAGNIKFLLHGRTAAYATIPDIIGGKVATRFGTSFGTNEEDSQSPYIWAPPQTIVVPDASTDVTGTVTYTNVNDTSSAAGTTTVTGTVAVTNANDTSAASGTTTVTGTSATTNANDTVSASGSPVIVGASATTNTNDTVAASGAVGSAVSGSVAYTNIDDTAVASGTTTVTGSVSVTNANDTASASGTTTIVGSSVTTNANDICAASGTVEAATVIGTVAYTNIDDIAAASGTTTIVGSSVTTNTNDAVSAFGVVNNGTIVEAGLTSGTGTTDKIKKPGIPTDAPAWLKTFLEIIVGRRGNKIEIPKFEELTFSATPTQAECEALYSYANKIRTAVNDIIVRLDS